MDNAAPLSTQTVKDQKDLTKLMPVRQSIVALLKDLSEAERALVLQSVTTHYTPDRIKSQRHFSHG